MLFRYINTRIWSKAGHFNKALSKGPKTTTWIWNLHSNAHDFELHIQQSSMAVITRKVFSSNLAHLSLVFFWISGMLFLAGLTPLHGNNAKTIYFTVHIFLIMIFG